MYAIGLGNRRASEMLILHTSDLHLSENRKETFAALENILEKCREHKVDSRSPGITTEKPIRRI